jgi:uncharacterized protein YbaR (Trm112 family)
MLTFITEMLLCPVCHGSLTWDIFERRGDRIEAGEARCSQCGASYPVKDGIGMFLPPGQQGQDLWETSASELGAFLQANPEIERLLLETPLAQLAPADQFYRGMLLEERGEFDQARAVFELASTGLYTPETLICQESQIHYLSDHLTGESSPVVDLASGRGELVQVILRSTLRPVIVTDISPRVLYRNQRWLEHFGLYERASLLACDARQTPFKSGSIRTLTTNLGLANLRVPGQVLAELRRVVAGTFLAICAFYPPEDEANGLQIRRLKLEEMLYRPALLRGFTAAGWRVRVENACSGLAAPTPPGRLLAGAEIDSLPVTATTLEWATLAAS